MIPTRFSAQPNVPGARWRLGLRPRFWVLLVLVGLIAGFVAAGMQEMLRAIEHLSWSYAAGELIDAVQHTSAWRRVAVLAAAGGGASLAWWALERSAGTRGGDLSDAIWSREAKMATLPTLVTSAISEAIIAMGASLGRESPPKEASAAIASWLAQKARLGAEERRLLVACAAGAGFAAIYNIPIGAAVFAVEVLVGSLQLPLVLPALAASSIATATSWLLLPIHPYYPAIPSYPVSGSIVLWAALSGPLLGFGAAGYVRLIAFAQERKARGAAILVAGPASLALLGAALIPFPQLAGNGKDIAEQVFLGGDTVVVIASLVALKPLVTALCLGGGMSGGLFTPTTSFGALAGALLGHLWAPLGPGTASGAYALVGATAVLAAGLNAPVSAIVLMAELTHRLTSLVVPSLLAVAGALLVSRWLRSDSVYSARLPLSLPAERWSASGRWQANPALSRPAPQAARAEER